MGVSVSTGSSAAGVTTRSHLGLTSAGAVLLMFVVQHVYSAMLMSKVEKTGTMDSIFGGWKLIPREKHRG